MRTSGNCWSCLWWWSKIVGVGKGVIRIFVRTGRVLGGVKTKQITHLDCRNMLKTVLISVSTSCTVLLGATNTYVFFRYSSHSLPEYVWHTPTDGSVGGGGNVNSPPLILLNWPKVTSTESTQLNNKIIIKVRKSTDKRRILLCFYETQLDPTYSAGGYNGFSVRGDGLVRQSHWKWNCMRGNLC